MPWISRHRARGLGAVRRRAPAFCFSAKGRVSKFIVDPGPLGDRLLDLLDKHPTAKARPVTSYGLDGWTLEMPGEMPDGMWRGPPLRPKRTR